MITPDDFLAQHEHENVTEIDWDRQPGLPVALNPQFVQMRADHTDAFEVAFATATAAPKADEVRALWKARWNRRAAPVALVVAHPSPGGRWKASVCGTKDDPAVIPSLDLSQVARICAVTLDAPDSAHADRTFQRLLVGQKDALVPGLTNSGLFASHELRHVVPGRPDYATARDHGAALLASRGADLIRGLGFTATPHGSMASILSADGANRAVAVLLDEHEVFDRASDRFGANSPVAQGMQIATAQNLPWLLITRGTQIRLYPTNPDIGVGRKGQTETYAEIDLALLADSDAAYLHLLFSSAALSDRGAVEQILDASAEHAAALGARLRSRVYEDVVPALAVAVAQNMDAQNEKDLDEAYHCTLTILFRLLFVAYAEDRGLLPYQRNPRYTRRALKTLAREFADEPASTFDPDATDRWDDLLAVWKAVDDGNREWGVPAYNGGLFAADVNHPTGHAIAQMQLSNAQIGPALRHLLIDTGEDGTVGPVDFRSLSVREFGTIYEGLLESSLSIAPHDLAIDPKTLSYVPTTRGQAPVVSAGAIYFHNASGARKATGSYFTKSFAVEHLLDTALEPAIVDHLANVASLRAAGDDAAAGEEFFNFRVIDLAMGSAHFLVAAIDRIERRFSAFLTEHPLPAVTSELARLADVARNALGANMADVEIETSALLRRQIARRCLYGLDLNVMAVELARLGIWIHTFVPGLPMSSLDHGLVVGNSLTGFATVDEVLEVLEPQIRRGQMSFFGEQIETRLQTARERLARVARTAEATKAEVHEASRAHANAMEDVAPVKALMDAALAVRLGLISAPAGVEEAIEAAGDENVQAQLSELAPAHLPYRFPEVALSRKGGFDVVLGNPPWEKVMWQAAPFWVSLSPGLMAIKGAPAREARIAELRALHPMESAEERHQQRIRGVQQGLFKSSFELRGGTHLELAQLMLERALKVRAQTGRIGLVLPRQCMVLAGWKNLRNHLVGNFDLDIVQARNHGEWIFDDVHNSYAVVLISIAEKRRGPVLVGVARSPREIAAFGPDTTVSLSEADLASLTDTNVIPWFNTPADREPFDIMRQLPRIASKDGWIRAVHDARWDFRGSGPDKALASPHGTDGSWKVLMTRHVDPYAFDTGEKYQQFLVDLSSAAAKKRGLDRRNGRYVLTDAHPVVIVRHPSRSDDSRTLVAHALPESGVVHNKGYIHALAHSATTSPSARLAALALLNTLSADWWARRFVDRHITAPVINHLPLPTWDEDQIETAARLASTLLTRRGGTVLAGGVRVHDNEPTMSDLEITVALERLALDGYGLNEDHLIMMSEDFTASGIPDDLADALDIPRRPKKKKGADQ